jgi:arylsulfatase A-like enzyme
MFVHHHPVTSRRDFLLRAGGGFGMLALCSLLEQDAARAGTKSEANVNPLAARPPHFKPHAKSVIWCFLDGGPSHLDLFDPKPELQKLDGKPLPDTFKRPVTSMGRTAYTPLLATKRTFKQHGKSGAWVSDWYPEIAGCVDDLAIIKSCKADGLNHVGSICQMNSGSVLGGRPSLGSWALYGLGAECSDLPGYVVLLDNADDPPGGSRNWSTGFIPSSFQGTKFREGKTPVLHMEPAVPTSTAQQRAKLDFIQELNRRHRESRQEDDNLEARIASYELAYRMQAAAPDVVDLSKETEETKRLYGLDNKDTERNGRNCLLARRLVERGVRFVQLYCGSGSKWDAHTDVEGNHSKHCRETDRPIAGLLKDLKRRKLLDSTLVIWGGEFGRTPMSESGKGRDHNPYGFTMWLAGGGIKGGVSHGATDEIGLYALDKPVHVHDIHATILDRLGLDHMKLTYLYNGRNERATVNGGKVIQEILA